MTDDELEVMALDWMSEQPTIYSSTGHAGKEFTITDLVALLRRASEHKGDARRSDNEGKGNG